MKTTIFDRNDAVVDALRREFFDTDVQIAHCGLDGLGGHDALVTAGNSYGIMNGGIDYAVRKMFGIEVQDAIQWGIVQHYGGMLPVGQCLVTETGREDFPQLVYAPTMVTPRVIVASDVGVAFAAILVATADFESMACPGLGTGVGGIPPADAAVMMRTAWEWVRNGEMYSSVRDKTQWFDCAYNLPKYAGWYKIRGTKVKEGQRTETPVIARWKKGWKEVLPVCEEFEIKQWRPL